ncbi:MAG: hypothetical protein GY901_03010, partial [Actinomycetia bacterium]|nr:hypothetical protein [Actinomycetes bacterium]
MYNNESNPTLTDCTFTANETDGGGGGMYNGFQCDPTLDGCTFTDNSALEEGGAMFNSASSPTLADCTFTGNSAGTNGGAMNNYPGGEPTLAGCTFTSNSAANYGGGMYNNESNPTLTNCTFTGNSANIGGGMLNYGGSPTLTGCTFDGNSSNSGGGMFNDPDSNPNLTDCTFTNNSVESSGGGIYIQQTSTTLIGCVFSDNSANAGGGIYIQESSPIVSGCTFTNNSANIGGGIYSGESNPTLTACRMWCNGNESVYGAYTDNGCNCIRNDCDECPDIPDTDGDGTPDCLDGCENDPEKTEPGICGCDVPETDTDTDGDGIADCVDPCPNWPHDCSDDGSELTVQPGQWIQLAINLAPDGGTVLLEEGVHQLSATLVTTGRAIEIRGIQDADGDGIPETIIDATGAGRAISCTNDEGPDTVFRNLLIRNGSPVTGPGSGMRLLDSSPTLVRCIFQDNTGSAMYLLRSSATLRQCGFFDNYSANSGGGMWLNDSQPTLIANTFTGNLSGGSSGAIHLQNGSTATITDSTFCGNGTDQIAGDGSIVDEGGNCITEFCDSDGDGVPECVDQCPGKDDTTDSDGDGIVDCVDPCPNWPYDCSDDGTTLTVAVGQPIQQAIDTVPDGGTVSLAAGEHLRDETLEIRRIDDGRSITLRGTVDTDGTTLTVLKSMGGSHRGIEIFAGSGSLIVEDLILEDFQNTAGRGTGIYSDGDVSIRNCSLIGNTGKEGGGLYLAGGVASIEGCLFEGNFASYAGGGTWIQPTVEAVYIDCRFIENQANSGGAGLLSTSNNAILLRCVFDGNESSDSSGLNANGMMTVRECVFENHTASRAIRVAGDFLFEACTITGNVQAIRVNSGSVTIADTTICDNGSTQIVGNYTNGGGNCILENCDEDADGVPDCIDQCLGEDDTIDSDGDGTPDCLDGCENDPGKIEPGDCGCGVPDTDTDGDGTLDCFDGCENDPDKIEPGDCGCGIPDTDSDLDGIADCLDPCPNWPYDCSADGTTVTVAVGQPIQQAIDAAPSGGIVSILAGTHLVTASVGPDGKAITIQGVADTDGDGIPETIIDAEGSGRVLACESGEGAGTVFRDLVIRNGASTTGSGMRIADSSPTILDCVFRDNGGTNSGGAVFILRSSPDFQNCRFLNNETTANGGALALNASHVTMAGCSIRDNSAGSNGGAIYLQNDSTIDVSDSTLCDNGDAQVAGDEGFNDVGGNCISDSCDSDNDGTLDCNDGCENDPDKTEPGECGCGVPETDTDGDGTPDCLDDCENDPDKTEPGECGCGVADTDTDGDGIADCNDPCPSWPYDCSDDGTTITVAVGQSIQQAMDLAPVGGTVALGEGTHNINSQILLGQGGVDKPLTIIGETDADGTPLTSIRAASGKRCFYFSGVVGPDTIIENLLITGGSGLERGAGMYCLGDPTINNCHFRDNSVSFYGGGMYNQGGSPTLNNCTFMDNSASNSFGGGGGGMFNDSSSPTLIECTFTGNFARQFGGGMWNDNSSPTLTDCTFTDNVVADTFWGSGAIYNIDSNGVTLTNASICGNSIPQVRGPYTDGGGNCILENCDVDADGVLDCIDQCLGEDDTLDSDGDGTPDCLDDCENDPDKTEPGECGCGVADTDSDGDGVPDCVDQCPGEDDTLDSDGDGTPDCLDDCENDPDKTEPGECGCGVADTDMDG